MPGTPLPITIMRRCRRQHHSILVALPKPIADTLGVTTGDYVAFHATQIGEVYLWKPDHEPPPPHTTDRPS